MVNSKDMLGHLKFSKTEQEIFNQISDKLDEQYGQSSLALEELDEQNLEEVFGPQSLPYCNALDRAEVLLDSLNNVLSMHPSILMDEQAFRLAQLAAGFINGLQRYLVTKASNE